MTKDELQSAFFNEFLTTWYSSDICSTISELSGAELTQYIKNELEDALQDLVSDFAEDCIEVMEDNNVIKAKKHDHEIQRTREV